MKVVADYKTGIILLVLRSIQIKATCKSRHTIITLYQIINGSYTIVGLGIYLLAMQASRHEFTFTGNHQLYAPAHTFATTFRYLRKQFHHLLTRQGQKADLILKRSHIQHITIGHFTLGQSSTNTAHVIHREIWCLLIVFRHIDKDIRKQV